MGIFKDWLFPPFCINYIESIFYFIKYTDFSHLDILSINSHWDTCARVIVGESLPNLLKQNIKLMDDRKNKDLIWKISLMNPFSNESPDMKNC